MTSSFEDLVDLASERFGGTVISCNDEFFGAKENLIKVGPAAWSRRSCAANACGITNQSFLLRWVDCYDVIF